MQLLKCLAAKEECIASTQASNNTSRSNIWNMCKMRELILLCGRSKRLQKPSKSNHSSRIAASISSVTQRADQTTSMFFVFGCLRRASMSAIVLAASAMRCFKFAKEEFAARTEVSKWTACNHHDG